MLSSLQSLRLRADCDLKIRADRKTLNCCSYLGYGLMAARAAVLSAQISQEGHACLPAGYTGEFSWRVNANEDSSNGATAGHTIAHRVKRVPADIHSLFPQEKKSCLLCIATNLTTMHYPSIKLGLSTNLEASSCPSKWRI